MRKNRLNKVPVLSFVFFIGAVGYAVLEIFWRGYTHWSMAVTGGFCFSVIYQIEHRYSKLKLWIKCILGCAVITISEFSVGIFTNRYMGWNVWDYSERPGNILGQICPLFSFLWFLLCFGLFPLSKTIALFFQRTQSEKNIPKPENI